MSFTPTKWTHHFGVWAGIAAALGGLGAIALSEFANRSAAHPHPGVGRVVVYVCVRSVGHERLVVCVQLRYSVVG